MAVAAVSSTRLARRTRGRGRRRGRRLGRRKPKECEHEGEAAATTRAREPGSVGVVEVEVIQVHGAPGVSTTDLWGHKARDLRVSPGTGART